MAKRAYDYAIPPLVFAKSLLFGLICLLGAVVSSKTVAVTSFYDRSISVLSSPFRRDRYDDVAKVLRALPVRFFVLSTVLICASWDVVLSVLLLLLLFLTTAVLHAWVP